MTPQSSSDRAFIGHPIGLGWLAASEFWERFCYYGMQALLTLYLFKYLLQPGNIEQVWGFAAFQHALDYLIGAIPWLFHKSEMAYASYTSQLYAGLVYVTPLIGGPLADRVLGRTATVTIGAAMMVAGTFCLAFNQTFLFGLAFLLAGVGCFKGNIAAQVGDLYSLEDKRRADGFQIYFMGIQLAVIVSPLICSTLGERVDWHLGFIAAGIGMLLGLVIYLFGRKTFPKERVKSAVKEVREPLSGRDLGAVILLVALVPVLAFSVVGNQQIFNAYLVWSGNNYQMTYGGFTVPSGWMMSFDALFSSISMIGVIAFWRWYGKHRVEPDEITKIAIGVTFSAFAPLALAGASAVVATTHHPVHLGWAVAFHVINDIGFANVLPVGLALYSRAAPKGLGGTMIAVYYLHLFFANTVIVGPLGGLLGTMPDSQFWMLHVALMLGAAVVLFLVRLFFGKLVAPR
ncbi:POT family proton-dependent oligopeptide transporter [Rhizomicrobium palustre]|uniref:POT family proton-dependent oligopeptide transporter n=1 Tax=Rhizomicrobium palustre TaxID=189966 RepID=A0A846N0L6_9PROT|nr:oligopeptide:H+ symporter [Rhizomicrobium palustre]NIK89039.1 POT family proton-dependent oligopeptide transporter [Rhizomicrobium palustre]